MVTLGKDGSLHARRTALAVLRQKNAVKKLFDDIAPRSADRKGGYTRIIKLGARKSDAAPVAFIEWVDAPLVIDEPVDEDKGKKRKGAKPAAAAEEAKPERKSKKSEKSEEK
jgi:large subunit ribosomal protein L17